MNAPDRFSARQWPDWSFWGVGRDRPGRPIDRSRVVAVASTGTALVIVAVTTILAVAGTNDTPHTVAAAGLIAGYAVACLAALWFGPLATRRLRSGLVVVVFALGTGPAVLLADPAYLSQLTFAIAVALMLLPSRVAVPLGFATALGQIAWMRLADGRVDWRPVVTLAAVTVVLGFVLALSSTIGQLSAAREQVRELAVGQERERVARDLHDLLGHSLSTITVKLGLARRQLESGEPDSALSELRELETLSRQALSDVRATVSGYRAVSLAAELAGARSALRAAGVRTELPTATDDVRPELQAVFAHVVREATTNILRHSTARRCTIRLGPDWVEIADDGDGIGEPVVGHGLTGLAERLAAVSGTFHSGRGPDGGFVVRACGPS